MPFQLLFKFIIQFTFFVVAGPFLAMADSSFDENMLTTELVDNPCFEVEDGKRVVSFSEIKKRVDIKPPHVTNWGNETIAIFETTCRKSKKQFLLLFKVQPGEVASMGSLTGFEFAFCSFKIDGQNKKITLVSSPIKDCKRETKEIVFFSRYPNYGRPPPPIQTENPPSLRIEDFSKNEGGFVSNDIELIWNSLHDSRFSIEGVEKFKEQFPNGVTLELQDLAGPKYDLSVFKTIRNGIRLGSERRFWMKEFDFSTLVFELDDISYGNNMSYSRVRLSLKPTTVEEKSALLELKTDRRFRWELFTYSSVLLGMTATIPGLIQNSRYPVANLFITSGLMLPVLVSDSSVALASAIIAIPYGLSSLGALVYDKNFSGHPMIGSAFPAGLLWIPFFVTSLNF